MIIIPVIQEAEKERTGVQDQIRQKVTTTLY
jgi:hypothetical protein